MSTEHQRGVEAAVVAAKRVLAECRRDHKPPGEPTREPYFYGRVIGAKAVVDALVILANAAPPPAPTPPPVADPGAVSEGDVERLARVLSDASDDWLRLIGCDDEIESWDRMHEDHRKQIRHCIRAILAEHATLREALRAAECDLAEHRAALAEARGKLEAAERSRDDWHQRYDVQRQAAEFAERGAQAAETALRQAQAERDAAMSGTRRLQAAAEQALHDIAEGREREARLVATFDAYVECGSSSQLRDLRAAVHAMRAPTPTPTTDAEETGR